ncbi:hypothetical protein [Bacillus toyonensis]|uniref:hypothetical protein n=1 Tax=Bacillus toyonensis TaxID=155322 RepID=UPI00352AD00B
MSNEQSAVLNVPAHTLSGAATFSIALQKAIVKSYIPEISRADPVRDYHQAAHLRRKLKMKKWGFLLLGLLCLGFTFINKELFFSG